VVTHPAAGELSRVTIYLPFSPRYAKITLQSKYSRSNCSMTEKTTKTGKELERLVAQAYRDMGARKVEHDVELSGHQIDVYVEMDTPDHGLHRIAVEAKDYARPVGIEIVSGFASVVDGLRRLKLVNEGIVVSANGFSRQARNAAREHGLRLLEPADLEAMRARRGAAPSASSRGSSAEPALSPPAGPAPLARAPGSPFVVGRPLRANEPIFGRDDTFRFVAGELAKFSSVNLVGERRMGKTSLLNHLIGRKDELLVPQPDQPPLVLACLDLQAGVSDRERFYGVGLRELLDRLPSSRSAEAHHLQELRERLHAHPETDYDEFERVLRGLRDSRGLSVRPVLVVDEFERLLDPLAKKGFPYPDFFNGLRALVTAELLAMVVASRCLLADYFRDPHRPGSLTSTFPSYFTPFTLSELDDAAADALLLQESDRTLTLREVARSRRWAGGHPCHLQAAGQAFYEAKVGDRSSRWVRRRMAELQRQSCMVGHTESGGVVRQPEGLPHTLRAVFLEIPLKIGRLAQRLGARISDVGAWLTGAAVILLLILALLGVVGFDDLWNAIKKGLGL
jgi:hypothetical protein